MRRGARESPMESERSENKSSLADWREVVESVAAFATSGGGHVRIGIGPGGERTRVRLGRGTLEDLANKIKACAGNIPRVHGIRAWHRPSIGQGSSSIGERERFA
jgi:predicted HTH transcriptional regulator